MKLKSTLLIMVLAAAALALAACGGGGAARAPQEAAPAAPAEKVEAAAPAGDPAAGKEVFVSTCSACHGPAGEGVTGLGKDMTTSEFIAGKTDAELVDFIKVGRDPSDPLNSTGVAMPPKGGNPALKDADLFNIVAFIRTIHK
jgi:disulfide bond formation protein DsbB